ncbi:hypothetical protein [Curtobacterium sp. Curtsp57]|uniref:hypothetical protein n=1 Tax=Curtobacterium sp. Curtsp57 TaxID=3243047 RepID=UPI0039B42EB3
MADTTRTLYAVARDADVITDRRTLLATARGDLAVIEQAMRTAGLEPDVQLVTITETTTYSDPEPYVEPAVVDEPIVTDQPVDENGELIPTPTEDGGAEDDPTATPATGDADDDLDAQR